MTWRKVALANCGMVAFIIGFAPLCVKHWVNYTIGYGLIFGGLILTLTIVLTPSHTCQSDSIPDQQ